jgi:hypothetical protein
MIARLALALLACSAIAATAAEPAAKHAERKYTPEVHGVLTSGRQPVSTNVCLRQGDSEIRSCGYADTSGRFFIPSSGPMRSANMKSDGRPEETPPKYWLETGNVQAPQKLWPLEIVADRNAAIDLACDMAQPGRSDPTFRSCEAKPARALVVDNPRDDTPFRMARPLTPAK